MVALRVKVPPRSETFPRVAIDQAGASVDTITGTERLQGALTVGFASIWTVNLEHDNVARLTP